MCVMLVSCFVCLSSVVCCALLYVHQDTLLQASASHASVCITEQLGHLLSGCLLHAICALQGPMLPCPGRQLNAALYKEKDNACSIWVEGVTGEKRVAVLSPLVSVSLGLCWAEVCSTSVQRPKTQ